MSLNYIKTPQGLPILLFCYEMNLFNIYLFLLYEKRTKLWIENGDIVLITSNKTDKQKHKKWRQQKVKQCSYLIMCLFLVIMFLEVSLTK